MAAFECVYDIDGNPIVKYSEIGNSIKYSYQRDETTGAFYSLLLVPQTTPNGSKQYPFTIWPNYPNGGIESALQMNRRLKYLVAINGAGFKSPYGEGVTVSGKPMGIIIQNGVVLQNEIRTDVGRTLTIDGDGKLGYAAYDVDGDTLVGMGIVSTANGYCPLVDDYVAIDSKEPDLATFITSSTGTSDAQRQCICQYGNGDYLIITSEGRGNQGSGFLTFKQMQTLCLKQGVRFAYMLDGGGSTETVVGDKQLNMIYENEYGRVMPTFIVFNGTTEFRL